MRPFATLTSHVVALTTENIDTDQIIPARFLKTISKAGLGQNLFADWCYDGDGRPRSEFPLNRPEAQGAQILLAGDNFGCGSSREHAPWALLDWGFRAVVSTSFADIFRNNALKNGLLPVVVDEGTHRQLCSLVAQDPAMVVTINLSGQTLTLPDDRTACTERSRSVTFPIDQFSKTCLLEGLDQLGYLLKQEARIAAYEQSHATRIHTRD